MNQPRHLVFGAGLIGGYLAGGLSATGCDISLVARKKIRKAMANGLTISDYDGHSQALCVPCFIEEGNPEQRQFDFLWLTVKCTAVAAITTELRSFVNSDTVIVCCQNGLRSDLAVRQAFPQNRVLRAIVGFNVAELAPGHLHRSTEGKLVIEADQSVTKLTETLNSQLLPVIGSTDIVAEQWAKLQLNLANPINALADIPVKAMTENIGFRRIISLLMLEMLAVSDRLELQLPKVTAVPARWIPHLLRLPDFIFTLLAQKMLAIDPTARTSMWWDLSAGRASEIDFLNGVVVQQGYKLGIACPLNQAIVDLVHRVETGEERIGFSAEALSAKLFDVLTNA